MKKTLSLKSSQSILDANELIQGLGVLDSRALAARCDFDELATAFFGLDELATGAFGFAAPLLPVALPPAEVGSLDEANCFWKACISDRSIASSSSSMSQPSRGEPI